MARFSIEVSLTEDQIKAIEKALEFSDRKMGMEELVQLLLSDVAQTITRPGSWEGANMLQVLTGHGLA